MNSSRKGELRTCDADLEILMHFLVACNDRDTQNGLTDGADDLRNSREHAYGVETRLALCMMGQV